MKITAKHQQTQPTESGNGQRGTWTKTPVLFEVQNGNKLDMMQVTFWGESKAGELIPGETYDMEVNVSSREYNGRYYTELTAWKIDGKFRQPQQAAQPQADNLPSDDLPF